MESRFPDPYDDQGDIGNPGGWIPDSLSEHHGDEDAISFTGNPDIRDPKGMKRNDRLRAGGARKLEFPATSRVASRTESRFPNPYDGQDDIGNPVRRIPDSLSEHHGDEDAISFTGNLDIQVPEGMKRNDGLCAGGA
ncbi:hypothetical protein NDU88_008804 [Pleurodeles waltl]|uniref:Uncharacterized protein n=1 Tax=Pleurodeles waltl TaxID=8319 RepID=A0AAV7PSM9_PLEWA|nr:hypothetical protein NDU88_008804 [Pleurodeles waltl]